MQLIKESKPVNFEDERAVVRSVMDIIDDVRARGDAALSDYSLRFDGYAREVLRVDRDEIDAAYSTISSREISDFRHAIANISAFASAQKETVLPLEDFSPEPGIHLSHRIIPVDSCCCYVPGGNYPLYSTAMMLITPAKAAGVSRVCAVSPVVKGTSSIHPKTLVAMDMAGADEVYALGGAQAVAAFAYGTEQIKPVDMIVGPGNKYVAEAKRQCYGKIGIDFVAGPSEVLIIADSSAEPSMLAADLLAQCEHDVNAKGILATTDEQLAYEVMNAVSRQLPELPTKEIAGVSWNEHGEIMLVESLSEAAAISNSIAPEHLELIIESPSDIMELLRNYGSLFIGKGTAEVFGDYASGTNHTLPTMGASRYTGGLWVGTFLKTCTDQWMDDGASSDLAAVVKRLAEGEGLAAHANAASLRIKR